MDATSPDPTYRRTETSNPGAVRPRGRWEATWGPSRTPWREGIELEVCYCVGEVTGLTLGIGLRGERSWVPEGPAQAERIERMCGRAPATAGTRRSACSPLSS